MKTYEEPIIGDMQKENADESENINYNEKSDNIEACLEYTLVFLKRIFMALIIGITGGLLGSVFHISIEKATELRAEHPLLLILLPVGGVVIAAIYRACKRYGNIDTNRVLAAARNDDKVPLVMAPLIFASTVITHLFGGSAGREGAALQLGGSIGYNIAGLLCTDKKDIQILVMTGMSAVFAALFGTPVTAAFFAIEVVTIGVLRYEAIVPCIISSVSAFKVAQLMGISPVRFEGVFIEKLSGAVVVKVVILAIICAAVSIAFCVAIHGCEKYMKKILPNTYFRALAGGCIIILLSLLLGNQDYNGAGMDIIDRAINGYARPEAFVLKILFTAVTISAGFKGGEIVPAFFVGSTLGCVAGGLLGLDASFAAALGMVSLFCGVVNCPVASTMLSIELFGEKGLVFFALSCAVSYMMSGKSGLYKSQKIMCSKLYSEETI